VIKAKKTKKALKTRKATLNNLCFSMTGIERVIYVIVPINTYGMED